MILVLTEDGDRFPQTRRSCIDIAVHQVHRTLGEAHVPEPDRKPGGGEVLFRLGDPAVGSRVGPIAAGECSAKQIFPRRAGSPTARSKTIASSAWRFDSSTSCTIVANTDAHANEADRSAGSLDPAAASAADNSSQPTGTRIEPNQNSDKKSQISKARIGASSNAQAIASANGDVLVLHCGDLGATRRRPELDRACQLSHPQGVCMQCRPSVASSIELLARVLRKRLQHAEPRSTAGAIGDDEGFVDQPMEQMLHVDGGNVVMCAHAGCRANVAPSANTDRRSNTIRS